jgi:hypothetical protein
LSKFIFSNITRREDRDWASNRLNEVLVIVGSIEDQMKVHPRCNRRVSGEIGICINTDCVNVVEVGPGVFTDCSGKHVKSEFSFVGYHYKYHKLK